METIQRFLESKGYKLFLSKPSEDSYVMRNEYSKKLPSLHVCDSNNTLQAIVLEYMFIGRIGNFRRTFKKT